MGQMIQGYACHENLVAQVRAQDGTERYLAVECLCGEPLVWHIDSALTSCSDMSLAQSTSINASTVDLQDLPCPLHETSITSLDSLSKKLHNANNVVQALDGPLHEPDDKTLMRLVFKGSCTLYFYRLAILAVTLHENEECCKLFLKNCY
jgi:hypothetical protein